MRSIGLFKDLAGFGHLAIFEFYQVDGPGRPADIKFLSLVVNAQVLWFVANERRLVLDEILPVREVHVLKAGAVGDLQHARPGGGTSRKKEKIGETKSGAPPRRGAARQAKQLTWRWISPLIERFSSFFRIDSRSPRRNSSNFLVNSRATITPRFPSTSRMSPRLFNRRYGDSKKTSVQGRGASRVREARRCPDL